MADYAVVASSVLPVAGSTIIDSTRVAGVALTAGQLVYLDTSANNWKLANATIQASARGTLGIAMAGANALGSAIIATLGQITFSAIFTSRSTVVGSGAVAGNIAPHADLITNIATWYPIVVGVPISTTVIQLPPQGIFATGI